MPPLIAEAIWPPRPAVNLIQRSAATQSINEEFAGIIAAILPFNQLLAELNSLQFAEEYNGFRARIGQPIHDRAYAILIQANRAGAPIPALTPDGEGGIEIEWEFAGRHLATNFSADGNGDFLSWREPHGRYEGDRRDDNLFVQRLEWLIGR